MGYRGVSAPSFRDGAIRFCTRLEKQGSRGGHRKHREKILEKALRMPWERPGNAELRGLSRRKRPFFSRRRDTVL